MYAQNAIAVNEFLGHSWQKVVISHFFLHEESRPDNNLLRPIILAQVVSKGSNDTLGVQILKVRGIFVDSNWYWIGVAALIGYIFMFNILFVLFLDWLDRKYQQVMSSFKGMSSLMACYTPFSP